MLENLYIKNFVLIDELNIDFTNNFSAFTGETGAGKSIFIDCIGCLLGDKLTTSLIRKGCDKTIIEGTFSINNDIAHKLAEAGFDDESLVITREINQDGKSTTRLNHRTSTVSFIKDLLTNYVDIHDQHENQYLLNDKYHLGLLDQFAQNDEMLKELSVAYRKYNTLVNKQNELLATTYNEAQLEVLKYQLNELENLHIVDVNEDEEINKQLKLYAQKEKMAETINKIKNLFENDGILDNLYEFTKLSRNLDSISEIEENLMHINDAYYAISDDYQTIIDKVASFDMDENSINDLNARLYQLQNAKRKYGTDLVGLVGLKAEYASQIDEYENKEFNLNKLNKEVLTALNEYNVIADKVHVVRQNKAVELSKLVIEQLRDLSLENAKFSIEFKEGKITSKGKDEVCFMVSMNKGQPLQPLSKVASGGELSRLMLGLKVIFAKLQGTRMIIFDEIDTGVSGYVALKIGEKMSNLGQEIQVFAVTHLPAVAACADNQYLISKQQTADSTNSKVSLLSQDERIKQLAILSSSTISDTSLAAAKELFETAQKACRG